MKLFSHFFNTRLYADAAASTPISRSARRALARLSRLYGNPGGLHKEAVAAKAELERARARVASAIGAHPDEIFFVSGGTEANNLALQGALRPLVLERGECGALTTRIEHSSVLGPLHMMEREGLYVSEVPVGPSGLVDIAMIREALNAETALVSVQMVNSEIGALQPIREVAKVLRAHTKKVLLHSDASQAPLWLPLKVDALGVDLMTLDGQKMLGPKGVGVLYVRRGVSLEPLLWGGGQERGLRSGTESVALAGAFAVALEEAQLHAEDAAKRVAAVRDLCLAYIKEEIPDAVLHGPTGAKRVANNIAISIPGLDGDMAVLALDARGIAASTRSACDTDDEAPSHVLAAIGVSSALAKNALRITFLPSATTADARRVVRALKDVRARYGAKG